ncbi:hypothetical protein [Comamonas thiooxydans]|nr:hypothetical protein [Comamonas thiooxydans]KGH23027.1 hypothetical protein P606_13415 [Comamonas thiooxydans]
MNKTILVLTVICFAGFIGKSALSASDPTRSLVENRPAAIEAKLDELTR